MSDLLLRGLAKFLGLTTDEIESDPDIKHFMTNSEALIGDVVYDAEARELYVTYSSGVSYTYYDITPQRFTAFKMAGSKGQYINYRIKQNGYIYSRGI